MKHQIKKPSFWPGRVKPVPDPPISSLPSSPAKGCGRAAGFCHPQPPQKHRELTPCSQCQSPRMRWKKPRAENLSLPISFSPRDALQVRNMLSSAKRLPSCVFLSSFLNASPRSPAMKGVVSLGSLPRPAQTEGC